MSSQLVTSGIVLKRIDYGEADRIITVITPDHGKLRLMAKGVRRLKSKLAGGIELFSVSDLTFIRGRGEIGTLVSARLKKYYGTIVQDIDRTMLGYELIKLLDKNTEDEPGEPYYDLLRQLLESLDHASIHSDIIRFWFYTQLLRLGGHTPNLLTDAAGSRLVVGRRYAFSLEDMSFVAREEGRYSPDFIKFLRIGFSGNPPKLMQQVTGVEVLIVDALQLVATLLPQLRP